MADDDYELIVTSAFGDSKGKLYQFGQIISDRAVIADALERAPGSVRRIPLAPKLHEFQVAHPEDSTRAPRAEPAKAEKPPAPATNA